MSDNKHFIILCITEEKPVKDITDLIASRAYTIDGVKDVTAMRVSNPYGAEDDAMEEINDFIERS